MLYSEAFGPKRKLLKAPAKPSNGIISPRDWQRECRVELRGHRFTLVSAPCGSGKSIALLLRAIDDAAASGNKQMIIVPQKVIGASFTEPMTVKNGAAYTWHPGAGRNLINYHHSSKLRALRRWLLADPEPNTQDPHKIDDCVVTSHQALAIVWKGNGKIKGFTAAEKAKAIHRLSITVDEAHHIKGVFDESDDDLSDEEREEANDLGEVIHYMVNSGDKTAKVCLGTATFYRGDSGVILDPAVQTKFKTFVHSWVDHFPFLHLEHFRQEYRLYRQDPIAEAVRHIEKDPKHIYLIYVPACGRAWRKKDRKNGETPALDKLFKKLYAIVPREQVLDLATRSTQHKNTQRFYTDVQRLKKGHDPAFKVIVACSIGLEGMDYPPADRLLNLAVQNSITRAIQVMGRPMREWYSKTKVLIYNYVPQFLQPKPGMTVGELFADRTNALLACLAWDDITHPLIITLPTGRKVALQDALGANYQRVLRAVLRNVEVLEVKSDEAVLQVIERILTQLRINDPNDAIAEALLASVRRTQLKQSADPQAQKVSTFFDIATLRKKGLQLVREYALERQTIYFADCGELELRTVQQMMRAQAVEIEKFAKEYHRLEHVEGKHPHPACVYCTGKKA